MQVREKIESLSMIRFILQQLMRKVVSLDTLGILFMSIFVLTNHADASEFVIALHEKATNETTNYAFDLNTSELRKVSEVFGNEIANTSYYVVRDQKLVGNGKVLMDADEILYQGQTGGIDLLVIREEYNSFSNPVRWLSALSGHPIQVNKILAVTIKDGNILAQKEIVKKPSSYHWSAHVFGENIQPAR